jgi:hypothetical protein
MRDPRIAAVVASFPKEFVRPTPNGGVHIWVHVPGYLQRTVKLAYGTPGQGKRPLLAEVRGLSRKSGKAGGYAVVTGPGRPPLRADFRPLTITVQRWTDTIAQLRACDTRPQRKPAERQSSPPLARTGDPLASRLDRVRNAEDGCRNGTLNAEVFLATVAEGAGSDAHLQPVHAAFIDAAVDAGLPPDEAQQTFDSAHTAAMQQLHDAGLWAGQALEAARQGGSRPTPALEACVGELCRRFALNGPELRVSVRQLADHVPPAYKSCARALGQLCEMGVLRVVSPGSGERGTTYRMVLRRTSNDTVVHQAQYMEDCVKNRASASAHQLRLSSAFIRKKGALSLPPGLAITLASIDAPGLKPKAIAERTGRSPETVRKHLQILQSMGLVSFGPRYARFPGRI